MPSPFPGMDPYLEEFWGDVHASLVIYARADVPLDLQALIDRCYDNGGYRNDVDYAAEPPVALAPDDADWADLLLREKDVRTGTTRRAPKRQRRPRG